MLTKLVLGTIEMRIFEHLRHFSDYDKNFRYDHHLQRREAH